MTRRRALARGGWCSRSPADVEADARIPFGRTFAPRSRIATHTPQEGREHVRDTRQVHLRQR